MEREGKGLCEPLLHPDEVLLQWGTGNGRNYERGIFLIAVVFILPCSREQHWRFSQMLQQALLFSTWKPPRICKGSASVWHTPPGATAGQSNSKSRQNSPLQVSRINTLTAELQRVFSNSKSHTCLGRAMSCHPGHHGSCWALSEEKICSTTETRPGQVFAEFDSKTDSAERCTQVDPSVLAQGYQPGYWDLTAGSGSHLSTSVSPLCLFLDLALWHKITYCLK